MRLVMVPLLTFVVVAAGCVTLETGIDRESRAGTPGERDGAACADPGSLVDHDAFVTATESETGTFHVAEGCVLHYSVARHGVVSGAISVTVRGPEGVLVDYQSRAATVDIIVGSGNTIKSDQTDTTVPPGAYAFNISSDRMSGVHLKVDAR